MRSLTASGLTLVLSVVAVACASEPTSTSGSTEDAVRTTDTASLVLVATPAQCEGTAYPFEAGTEPSLGRASGIAKFFEANRIAVKKVGFTTQARPTLACASCGCEGSESVIVVAASAADAATLKSKYKFDYVPENTGYAIAGKQCDNPWTSFGAPKASESTKLLAWTQSLKAPVTDVGVLFPVPARTTCAECSCLRASDALVFSYPELARPLTENGFSSLTAAPAIP